MISANSSKCKHKPDEERYDVVWERIKKELGDVLEQRKPCTCMRELRPYENYAKTLTLVTATGSEWFAEARNLVASIHKWEGTMRIVVYDLGMTKKQLEEANTWANVEVVGFEAACQRAEKSPAVKGNPKLCSAHVKNGAWRPFVLLDAALEYGEYLFLHPGYEVVNTLHLVALQLYRDSVFSVTNEHDILEYARPEFLEDVVGGSRDFFEFKPLCTPNLFGYVCNKEYFYKVLVPMAGCARDYKRCWAAAHNGEKADTYTVDDVVATAYLLNNTCYTCNRDTNVYDSFPHGNLPKTATSLYWHLRRRIDILVPRMKNPKLPGMEPKLKSGN